MTDTTESGTAPARIRVRGLTKSFGDRQVLRGIDFESARGTSTVLLGPSGSGKT
ncbi:MAG: glutamine ABC transporter ATP-binding protein GlnQ, partial [Nocardia sp.]|nr:glutamine ABC transporter ATP-binding protein GlnQ [Nocardia sp.]